MDENVLVGLGLFVIILALLVLAGYVLFYVLYSLGVMKVAQNRGLERSWMAWIPLFGIRSYLVGEIADDVAMKTKGKTTYFRWINFGVDLGITIISNFVGRSLFSNYRSILNNMDDPSEIIGYVTGNVFSNSILINLLTWGFLALQVYLIYTIAQDYNPNSATGYAIASGIIGFIVGMQFHLLILFTLRNHVPIAAQQGGGFNQGVPNQGYNPGPSYGNAYNPNATQPSQPSQFNQPNSNSASSAPNTGYDPNAAAPYNDSPIEPPQAPDQPEPPEPPNSI